jgi:hypothetical protein
MNLRQKWLKPTSPQMDDRREGAPSAAKRETGLFRARSMHKMAVSCIVLKIAHLQIPPLQSPQAVVAPGVMATDLRFQGVRQGAREIAPGASKKGAIGRDEIGYAPLDRYAFR